jgi:hypothetical protein
LKKYQNQAFHSLRIESIKGDALYRAAMPTTSLSNRVGDQLLDVVDEMQNKETTCLTRATLANIRRIRISMGKPHRSRGSNNVSGIMIEYLDDSIGSIVLGQWMEEAGVLEMVPGEKLTQISAWAWTANQSLDLPAKLVGISLRTSKGQHWQVCTRKMDGPPNMHYETSPFDELVSISRQTVTHMTNHWLTGCSVRWYGYLTLASTLSESVHTQTISAMAVT